MTCPLNPKYIAKLARIAAAQKDATDASEQATRNVAAEQATNASWISISLNLFICLIQLCLFEFFWKSVGKLLDK